MQILNSNGKGFPIATLDWITAALRIYASIVRTIQMSLHGQMGVYTPMRLVMVGCGVGCWVFWSRMPFMSMFNAQYQCASGERKNKSVLSDEGHGPESY